MALHRFVLLAVAALLLSGCQTNAPRNAQSSDSPATTDPFGTLGGIDDLQFTDCEVLRVQYEVPASFAAAKVPSGYPLRRGMAPDTNLVNSVAADCGDTRLVLTGVNLDGGGPTTHLDAYLIEAVVDGKDSLAAEMGKLLNASVTGSVAGTFLGRNLGIEVDSDHAAWSSTGNGAPCATCLAATNRSSSFYTVHGSFDFGGHAGLTEDLGSLLITSVERGALAGINENNVIQGISQSQAQDVRVSFNQTRTMP